MKQFFKSIILLAVLFLLPPSLYGQVSTEGVQGGIQGNILYPSNDFSHEDLTGSYELSYLGRGFLRFGMVEGLQIELGGGYGIYTGKDFLEAKYETEIIPVELRFNIHPFKTDNWDLFFYAGFWSDTLSG